MINKNNIYDAETIAAHIIKLSNEKRIPITNLRLQKQLYFVQGLSFARLNRPAFKDDIEAWNYGPVVPRVYRKYSYKGSFPIEAKEARKMEVYLNNKSFDTIFQNEEYDDIDNEMSNVIVNVIEATKEYDDFNLVNLTHREGPWRETYLKKSKDKKIENEKIKLHFKRINGK